MDLRPYQPSASDVEFLKQRCGYQPFILTDDCQLGEAYMWCTGRQDKMMEKPKASQRDWKTFVDANTRMRNMYEGWIAAIAEAVGFRSGMSVVDVAANDGYFLYRFLQLGAGDAVGFDIVDKTSVYDVMNRLLGLNARFVHDPYDAWNHRIKSATPADIVLSSAIMCHMSDPLYHLAFVASIARKALFLFSTIDNNPSFRILYDGANYYRRGAFPVAFDKLNHVSRSLVDHGLKELGFTKIVDIHWRREWLPWSWYKEYQGLIALR